MTPIEPETVHPIINYKKVWIFIGVLFVVAIIVSMLVPAEKTIKDVEEDKQSVATDGIKSFPEEDDVEYSIGVMNNQLVICHENSNDYEETNICIDDLPLIEQQKVKEGSYQVDEAALYDFLETYTS
jgi:hypothetical protein